MVVKECIVPTSWLPYLADEIDGMPNDPDVNSMLLSTCPQGYYLHSIASPLTNSSNDGEVETTVFMIYKQIKRTITINF